MRKSRVNIFIGAVQQNQMQGNGGFGGPGGSAADFFGAPRR